MYPTDNWTMRATSTGYFYSGVYRFSILADDEVVLTVDNVIYLDTRGKGQSGKTQIADIPMTQGNHNMQRRFPPISPVPPTSTKLWIGQTWHWHTTANTQQTTARTPAACLSNQRADQIW